MRGHKHRSSPMSVGLLVSVTLAFFISLSTYVFPPHRYLQRLSAKPGSDAPA